MFSKKCTTLICWITLKSILVLVTSKDLDINITESTKDLAGEFEVGTPHSSKNMMILANDWAIREHTDPPMSEMLPTATRVEASPEENQSKSIMAKMNTAYKTAWNFVKKSASGAFHAVTNAAKSIWHGFTNLFG